MRDRIRRVVATVLISVGVLGLVLGVLLFEAAYTTGAYGNYTISVSWSSAFMSVLWPPDRLPALPLAAVAIAGLLAWFSVFRVRRGVGVGLLLVQAAAAWWLSDVGFFFISREIAAYHFRLDAERLGEQWFLLEAEAVWVLLLCCLAVLTMFGKSRSLSNGSKSEV